jgi:TPR repeat protein
MKELKELEKTGDVTILLYKEAAERGNSDAQCNLAHCYEFGNIVDINLEKAVEWYTKAAEQGNAFALYSLGVCYEEGNGVAIDKIKAVEF